MIHSLKNLLGDAVGRAKITREVTTARLFEVANAAIHALLPKERHSDAWAGTYKDGVLTIHCSQASAADHLRKHAQDISGAIKQSLPTAHLVRIVTHVVHGKSEALVIP